MSAEPIDAPEMTPLTRQQKIEGDLLYQRVLFGPWWRRRCIARVEPNPGGYWGRCDRRRRHDGDHALERGFYIFRWSTRWVRIEPFITGKGDHPPTPYPPPVP